MIVPGARAPLFSREVCAPCSTGPVGTLDAPDKHFRAVGTSAAVDTGESLLPHVVVLEHVLGSARLGRRALAVSPSTSTFMPKRSRRRLPLTWLKAYIKVDGSAKRHHVPMAYTRSRSERRSRRATSECDAILRGGERVNNNIRNGQCQYGACAPAGGRARGGPH